MSREVVVEVWWQTGRFYKTDRVIYEKKGAEKMTKIETSVEFGKKYRDV